MKLTIETRKGHSSFGSTLEWINERYFVTCGDDHMLMIWDVNESLQLISEFRLPDDFFPTSLAPQSPGSSKSSAESIKSSKSIEKTASNHDMLNGVVLGVGGSDGRVLIVQLGANRVLKDISCHQGAVTALRFSSDASALLTGSEDGQLKVWSGNGGLLRCTLATHPHPIHCARFVEAPFTSLSSKNATGAISQSAHIAYCVQDQLIITSLAPNSSPTEICVHRGQIITRLAYSSVHRQLLTNDECGCVRIFDLSGKQLLRLKTSATNGCITWSPDGRCIAIASGSRLEVFTVFGQLLAIQSLAGPSRSLQFDSLNRTVALLQLDGVVGVLRVCDVRFEYGPFSLTMHTNSTATFVCASNLFEQRLDFAGTCIRHACFGHSRLLLVLDAQCLNYPLSDTDEQALASPSSASLAHRTYLSLLANRHFALMDERAVLTVYDHQCRQIASMRNVWSANYLPRLQSTAISLNCKYVMTLNPVKWNQIRLFALDATSSSATSKSTGRTLAEFEHVHSCDIMCVTLAQQSISDTWCAAFLDSQQQLFLIRIPTTTTKFACIQVNSRTVDVRWHDQVPVLVSLQPSCVEMLLCPLAAMTDTQLMADCVQSKSFDIGTAQLIKIQYCTEAFIGSIATDGVRRVCSINHTALLVLLHLQSDRTQQALSLVQQSVATRSLVRSLWSLVTAYGLFRRDMSLALKGYVALRCSVKVLYLERLQQLCASLTDPKVAESIRASELALLCGDRIEQAEMHLLRAGLVIRLILLHLQAFDWDRALQMAARFDQQIPAERWTELNLTDTDCVLQRLVLTYRIEYLQRFELIEKNEKFLQLADMTRMDEETVDTFEQHQYTFRC